LKEARAAGLSFELLNRNVDQPFKYVATWLIDEWSKIGLHMTARGADGPLVRHNAQRKFSTSSLKPMGHGVVNPPLDVQKHLPASFYSEN
jgi:peptide/nickel transport system substrate-binding protein